MLVSCVGCSNFSSTLSSSTARGTSSAEITLELGRSITRRQRWIGDGGDGYDIEEREGLIEGEIGEDPKAVSELRFKVGTASGSGCSLASIRRDEVGAVWNG